MNDEALLTVGLSEAQVLQRRKHYGPNIAAQQGGTRLGHLLWGVVREPMFVMLLVACLLYFLLREPVEGLMMLAAMVLVAAISLYQESRSARALASLLRYSHPAVQVVRGGQEQTLASEELVPGDIILLSEGELVPADARVLRANDLLVDESVLTGESLPVAKDSSDSCRLYQGTVVSTGKCTAVVTATGNNTRWGKLGKAIANQVPAATRLQQQIGVLVKRLAAFGLLAFVLIFGLNYLHTQSVASSLLLGLTLAMAALPEEIPVAFSSFMALGAYRMAQRGIITRQPQTVENLGAVTVICFDKTGTITENQMALHWLYDACQRRAFDLQHERYEGSLLYYALLASEQRPFDPMEQAIERAWKLQPPTAMFLPAMVHEYPLEGKPPMMTHVYPDKNDGYLAVAKGGVERMVQVCRLPMAEQEHLLGSMREQAAKGFRMLGVATARTSTKQWPANQEDFNWQFAGMIGLYDPPKKGIAENLQALYQAGITVKLITGDHPQTAQYIARQVGLHTGSRMATGDTVMQMDAAALRKLAAEVHLFARMFPEAKLKVIEALKANGETVAMTGDGVNDGPAIRSAHIGIAMGRQGTEIARKAADLVLTNDDLSQVIEGIRQGRRIYTNLKKAVRYIISIHIPIILTASLPLLLGWHYPNIFTPIHVIFLELIMGPTCSIFFEREPAEANSMHQPPRSAGAGLLGRYDAVVSVVQGLVITAGVLLVYYRSMQSGQSLELTRTLVFVTLICSNILLTFANRSFTATLATTITYRNRLAPWVVLASLALLGVVLWVPPVRHLFGMVALPAAAFLQCMLVASVSVLWFEVYKWMRFRKL